MASAHRQAQLRIQREKRAVASELHMYQFEEYLAECRKHEHEHITTFKREGLYLLPRPKPKRELAWVRATFGQTTIEQMRGAIMWDPTGLVDDHDRKAEQHDADVLGAEIERLKIEKTCLINELADALNRIEVFKKRLANLQFEGDVAEYAEQMQRKSA